MLCCLSSGVQIQTGIHRLALGRRELHSVCRGSRLNWLPARVRGQVARGGLHGWEVLSASQESWKSRNFSAALNETASPSLTLDVKMHRALGLAKSYPWSIALRSMATNMRPQELHRHRKRLEGFGKDAPKGDTKTLAACGDLLKDDDWYARKVAIDTIAKVANHGDEVHLALLYKHLEDDDIFVREASTDAVAEIAKPHDDVAITKVAMRLADEDCFVRTRAVVALGRLGQRGDAQTVGLLDEMFEDGFVPVRKKAIEALIQLAPAGDKGAIELLKRCLNDSDRGVREEAKEALAKFERLTG